ncbi:HAD domain-containing protein [Streptomyces sp. NPDC050448]|uniref:HAD domain-containing protein n=1 Tax=Streptomyces sp. NPDC050448 TaxID=3155404 RepID=UPI0034327C86
MTGPGQRPLLFLDIDGPLIPFGATPHDLPDGYPTYGTRSDANPLLARLDPALGPRLLALPGELVWATTWMADANTWVAPRIGLPQLPVVAWPDPSEEEERERTHWKTRALVDRAAGRPFAWVDDEITDADRTWVAAHHPGPALLHRVDPRFGLRPADFAALDAWLRGPRPQHNRPPEVVE